MSALDQQPVTPAIETPIASPSRISRWIEDPFVSVIGGIIVPTVAVVFLLSAMAGLSSLLPA